MLHNVWYMAYTVTVWELLTVCLNHEWFSPLQCESFPEKEKGLSVTVMDKQLKETSEKYIRYFHKLLIKWTSMS